MRLLRGAVEVALAGGFERPNNCPELEAGAEAFGTPGFRAWAAHARGAILVQRGSTPRRSRRLGQRCVSTAPAVAVRNR